MAGGIVTFNAAGTCDVNASQAGTSTFLQAPVSQQAIVVIPGTGTTFITGNNILFYVRPTGGSVNFGNTSSVQLTPLASGLTIWDASTSGTASVTLTNIGTSINTYGGIYIPDGSVNVTSTSYASNLSAMFIVAQTMNMGSKIILNVTGP
jgi:hypothetical protein